MTLFSAIPNRRLVPVRDPYQCEGSTGNIIERLKMPRVDSGLSPAKNAGSRFQKKVVQHHLQLPYMAPPEYLPGMGTHQAQERRAVGALGQLRWTTARKTPLEVWLPGNLLRELWWFPGGLTGYQSGPDLKCAPNGENTPPAWRVLHCGSA